MPIKNLTFNLDAECKADNWSQMAVFSFSDNDNFFELAEL